MLNRETSTLASVSQLKAATAQGLSCVYLTAPWCAFCRLFEPKYREFERYYPQVKYYKLDVEEVQELEELKDIHNLPSLLLYSDGALVNTVQDLPRKRPGRKLALAIRTHLFKETDAAETYLKVAKNLCRACYASQSKVQPMSRSAVSVRNKKSIQLKKNQISPDFTSAPASTAAVPSTNDNDPLLLQQSSPDVVSIADPLTLQDTILDTASELHLGQGPFDASGSAVNSSQGVAEACGVQLASCGSIMPGQTVGDTEHTLPAPQTGNDATGIPVPKTDIEPVQFSNSCSTATDVPLLQDVITPLAASPDLAAARSSDTSAIASAQGSVDVVKEWTAPTKLTIPSPIISPKQTLSPLGKKPPLNCSDFSPADGAIHASCHWTSSEAKLNPRSSLSPAGDVASSSNPTSPPMPHASQPKALRVHTVTFNMAKQNPQDLPEQLLGRAGCPTGLMKYDVVVVGTQESGNLQDWYKVTGLALGSKYAQISSHSMGKIAMVVFVRLKLQPHISEVQTSSVATGIGNIWHNKGAVGITLTYMKHTRLLFINAHFNAHDKNVAQRQADYLRIRASLFSNSKDSPGMEWPPFLLKDQLSSPSWSGPSRSPMFRSPNSRSDASPMAATRISRLLHDETGSVSSSEGSFSNSPTGSFSQRLQSWAQPSARDVADDYHVTIWLGDLNYRVDTGGNRQVMDHLKDTGMLEEVSRGNDQLGKERRKGKVFQGYEEGELTFPPTYKFDPGTDHYDTSAKRRIPSWCDRVLWRCHQDAFDSVELLQYTSIPQLKVSDHRPVVATFLIQAQPVPEGLPAEKGFSGVLHKLQHFWQETLVKRLRWPCFCRKVAAV